MHGVKNHFQILTSLFELQLMDIKNEAASLAVQESLGRLRVITVLYKNLSALDSYATVDFERVVIEILQQVSQTNTKIDNAIKSAIHLPNLTLEINTAIPLGLILNELLMNSFTRNKKSDAAREISIRLVASKEETQCIEYMDTGIELPKGFDLSDNKLPFGMRMVSGLSRQLGGRTEVPNKSECRFKIFFRNNQSHS
jgi:two-component sensor histidine kinase